MAATATARGLLMLKLLLRPSHGTDMLASTAMDSQPMVAMGLTDWATARGLLMLKLLLRPSHGTDMVAFTATDSQPMVVTPTAMARGLLMLRPSHGVASTAMDSVWATVMEDLDAAMAATAMASKQP